MWQLVCLFSPSLVKKLCGREVEELCLLGFSYKKREREKTQRADRVQWPSFLQAGMPVSACHIGHSTASDFRAERAVSWVGGQMEGGCKAQLSSASFPLLAHSLSPHLSLSIHLFIQFSQSFLCLLSHFPSAACHFIVRYYFSMVSLYLTAKIKSQNKESRVCKSNLAQR